MGLGSRFDRSCVYGFALSEAMAMDRVIALPCGEVHTAGTVVPACSL